MYKNKITTISILLIILSSPVIVHAQRVFMKDSTYLPEKSMFVGTSNTLFNYYTMKWDTLINLFRAVNLPPRPDTFQIWVYADADTNLLIHGKVYGFFYKFKNKPPLKIFEMDYNRGTAIKFYQSSVIANDSAIVPLEHGTKHGTQIVFGFGKSKFVESTEFANDIREGQNKVSQDGQVIYFATYANGLKEGIEYALLDNGEFIGYMLYRSGKVVDGTYPLYFYGGKKYEDKIHKNDFLVKRIKYDDNEKVKSIIKYKKKKKSGVD